MKTMDDVRPMFHPMRLPGWMPWRQIYEDNSRSGQTMRRFQAAVLVTSILVIALPSQLAGSPIPDRFTSRNPYRKAPVWIALDNALTPEGDVRVGVLEPHEERQLHREMRNAAALRGKSGSETPPCDVTFGGLFDDAPDLAPPLSWQALVDRSGEGTVFRGVISAERTGLYAGTPFTVLRIDVAESSRAPAPVVVYVLFPRASATLNGQRVCTADPSYAELPVVGDAITVVTTSPIDADGTLFRIPAESILYEHAHTLIAAPRLARTAALAAFPSLRDAADVLVRHARAARD